MGALPACPASQAPIQSKTLSVGLAFLSGGLTSGQRSRPPLPSQGPNSRRASFALFLPPPSRFSTLVPIHGPPVAAVQARRRGAMHPVSRAKLGTAMVRWPPGDERSDTMKPAWAVAGKFFPPMGPCLAQTHSHTPCCLHSARRRGKPPPSLPPHTGVSVPRSRPSTGRSNCRPSHGSNQPLSRSRSPATCPCWPG